MADTEVNPGAVFCLLFLIFITLTLIQYVFFVFSIWSLAIGGLLGFLLLRNYQELPNLLTLLQVTGTINTPKNINESPERRSRGCTICSKKGCSRHKPGLSNNNDLLENFVPKTVDDALAEFMEIVLNTHVYSWYRDLSHDQGFVDEVRFAIYQASSVILQRLQRVNLSEFLVKRVIKKFMLHIDCFFYVKERVNNTDDVQQLVLDQMKTYKHFCIQSESAEEEYLRYTIQTLLPSLLPKSSTCKAMDYFLEEILDCILLKPLVEKIVEPDFINQLLLIFLDEATIPEPNYLPSEKVNFLEIFGKHRAKYSQSSLTLSAYELLHDAVYLYPFMQFMKQEGALNILQFCLAVEEFNKRILAAELTETEEAQIVDEAEEIDDLYFKTDAVDKINFPIDIIQDFKDGISSKEFKVTRTRAAAPLFRAYAHAFDILEKVYVPLFHQSDEFFSLKCGERNAKVKKSTDNNSSKRKFISIADLLKITSKIKAKKLQAKGEKRMSFHDLNEEAYESYEDEDDNDESDIEGNDCGNDDCFDFSNYYHITIPKIDYVLEKNKRYYVFILNVEKIGGKGEDGDDCSWQVIRKYNEFYVLDNKLRRFHDVLNDAELPGKRTILKKDFEYLNSIRLKLQEYLQRLSRSPVLKGSSLLQSFLTPGTEIDGMFEPDSVGREAGRKVKSLKSKLVIEKGQNLEVFLNSFISSAEPIVKKKIFPKPVTHMFSTHRRHNSLIILPPPAWARELRRSLSDFDNRFSPSTITQFILYASRNYFKVPTWVHHLLVFLQFIAKNTIDVFVEKFISYKISLATAELQMVSYIHLVRDVIFFDNDPPRTDSDKVERRDKTLNLLLNYFPRRMKNIIGVDNHDQALKNLFEMLQYPKLNKQLFYVLFDELLYELFPEIKFVSDDKT